MKDIIQQTKQEVEFLVKEALGRAVAKGTLTAEPIPAFTVEVPADTKNGDFACNAAMVSARAFHKAPRQIAQAIEEELVLEGSPFVKMEVAGPGFLNFFVSQDWFANIVKAVQDQGKDYGRTDLGKGKKVMVEFVSANPTGPMHIGNARGGAIGDCLASVLEAAGYDVTREFYINDAGNQIHKFGVSLSVRYQQIFLGEEAAPLPEDAYQGADIMEHAKNYADLHGDALMSVSEEERQQALVDYALPLNIAGLKRDLARYRIYYDVWFKESTLHESGAVQQAIDLLTQRGYTYEQDGTLFYKATAMGQDKDDVLVRSNGIPTYFAADIAYHYNKFAVRGFDKVINIWGADHHGHVARLQGAMDAIGLDGRKLDVVLMQLVKLMREGKPVRVSKRTGKSITLATLLDEVPIDAARFFFNQREPASQMEFDLDLAVEQSSQNPVYYVQYAHARICSIFAGLEGKGITYAPEQGDLNLLTAPEERELIRYLATLPGEINGAAKAYDPARITRYSIELATLFHKFYNACRVQTQDNALTQARLLLCGCVRQVLCNVLDMLKIDHPERM